MNKDKLSYCGLICESCPIHLATIEPDKTKQTDMRAQIAKTIRDLYGTPTTVEDVTDCDGCKANTGKLFSGCSGCKMRHCAQERGYATCAECPEYPCDELARFFKSEPNAQINLDSIKICSQTVR